MTEESGKIKTTFSNLLKIYNETGSLLQDAEAIMEKAGYRCLHGNYTGTEQSKNINNPTWWITPYASRYYSSDDNPFVVKAIGVFFVDIQYNPIDPIIIYGSFNMKKNENDERLYIEYLYLKHGWFPRDVSDLESEYDLNENYNYHSGKIGAIPLEKVTNQETLEELIIKRLLAL